MQLTMPRTADVLTGSLSLPSLEPELRSTNCALQPPPIDIRGQYALEICKRNEPQRPHLERFVQEGFQRAHGARIHSFMPVLLALRDGSGQVVAVTGLRPARRARLYLENYLDGPVERAIERTLEQTSGAFVGGRKTKKIVARRSVAEIGNFAARDRTAAQQLMRLLPGYLFRQGFLWIAFTATLSVRRLLAEFGVQPLELCAAHPGCIPCATDDWGDYYNADPRVMAGFLPAGLELEAFKAAETSD